MQEKRWERQPKRCFQLHNCEKEHQKIHENDIAESHYATSDTLFFYQILLKQILQTEDQPENCPAREKSRLMSLLSLVYLWKRSLALRHAIPSPSESTEGVLEHKMQHHPHKTQRWKLEYWFLWYNIIPWKAKYITVTISFKKIPPIYTELYPGSLLQCKQQKSWAKITAAVIRYCQDHAWALTVCIFIVRPRYAQRKTRQELSS